MVRSNTWRGPFCSLVRNLRDTYCKAALRSNFEPAWSPFVNAQMDHALPPPDAADIRLGVTGREEYGESSTLKALAVWNSLRAL